MKYLTVLVAISSVFVSACGSAPNSPTVGNPSNPSNPVNPTTCSLNGRQFNISTGKAFSGFVASPSQVETDIFFSNGDFSAFTIEAASGTFWGTWSLSGFNLTITWTPAINEGSVTLHHEYFLITQENNCATITWDFVGND